MYFSPFCVNRTERTCRTKVLIFICKLTHQIVFEVIQITDILHKKTDFTLSAMRKRILFIAFTLATPHDNDMEWLAADGHAGLLNLHFCRNPAVIPWIFPKFAAV